MNTRLRSLIPSRLQNFSHYFAPLAITGVALVIFLIAVANLSGALTTQFESGEEAQNFQLTEGSNSFFQLQREALHLLALVMEPADERDATELQTQIDLLNSRFFQLELFSNSSSSPESQAAVARNIVETYAADTNVLMERWLDAAEPESLQTELTDQLTALDLDVNSQILSINRERVQSVIALRGETSDAQSAFLMAGAAFALLMLASLFVIYSYLRQSQQTAAALQAVRFKDEFLAIMSHELRTPLNAIIGFLGLMRMTGVDTEKFPHMVDRARTNANRLLSLIDDILDMSKIGAGRFEIHAEPINIRELVARWSTQTEVLAQQKGVEFSCQLDSAVPAVISVDPDALSKLVTNLLSNAVKFTEKGSVRLVMKPVNNNQLQISVADTGIGIPENMQTTVFESFRQVDNSIQRTYGGSGLGLSIVRELTALLGGKINLESRVGVGSTFTIVIPLVTPTASSVSASEKRVASLA